MANSVPCRPNLSAFMHGSRKRLDLQPIADDISSKYCWPAPTLNDLLLLGGITLSCSYPVLHWILAMTFYYKAPPSPEAIHLRSRFDDGRDYRFALIRSVHRWSASMIGLMLILARGFACISPAALQASPELKLTLDPPVWLGCESTGGLFGVHWLLNFLGIRSYTGAVKNRSRSPAVPFQCVRSSCGSASPR